MRVLSDAPSGQPLPLHDKPLQQALLAGVVQNNSYAAPPAMKEKEGPKDFIRVCDRSSTSYRPSAIDGPKCQASPRPGTNIISKLLSVQSNLLIFVYITAIRVEPHDEPSCTTNSVIIIFYVRKQTCFLVLEKFLAGGGIDSGIALLSCPLQVPCGVRGGAGRSGGAHRPGGLTRHPTTLVAPCATQCPVRLSSSSPAPRPALLLLTQKRRHRNDKGTEPRQHCCMHRV